jgi:hypothetical protein
MSPASTKRKHIPLKEKVNVTTSFVCTVKVKDVRQKREIGSEPDPRLFVEDVVVGERYMCLAAEGVEWSMECLRQKEIPKYEGEFFDH